MPAAAVADGAPAVEAAVAVAVATAAAVTVSGNLASAAVVPAAVVANGALAVEAAVAVVAAVVVDRTLRRAGAVASLLLARTCPTPPPLTFRATSLSSCT